MFTIVYRFTLYKRFRFFFEVTSKQSFTSKQIYKCCKSFNRKFRFCTNNYCFVDINICFSLCVLVIWSASVPSRFFQQFLDRKVVVAI